MPKRTDDFQKLIALLEKQLAPDGGVVTESKMVDDLVLGVPREIDVHIEVDLGIHRVCIGVECRDRSRPAGIEWVEEVISKYQNLPVDKVVLVSRSGFTTSALRKAMNAHITTLTLAQVSNVEWGNVIHQLNEITVAAVTTPMMRNLTVTFTDGTYISISINGSAEATVVNTSSLTLSEAFMNPVLFRDGREWATVPQVFEQILREPELVQRLQEQTPSDYLREFFVDSSLMTTCGLMDSSGSRQEISSAVATVHVIRTEGKAKLQHNDYGAAKVSWGITTILGNHRTLFAFSEREGWNLLHDAKIVGRVPSHGRTKRGTRIIKGAGALGMAQGSPAHPYRLVVDGNVHEGDDLLWDQLYEQDPNTPRGAPWRFLRNVGPPVPALVLNISGEKRLVRRLTWHEERPGTGRTLEVETAAG